MLCPNIYNIGKVYLKNNWFHSQCKNTQLINNIKTPSIRWSRPLLMCLCHHSVLQKCHISLLFSFNLPENCLYPPRILCFHHFTRFPAIFPPDWWLFWWWVFVVAAAAAGNDDGTAPSTGFISHTELIWSYMCVLCCCVFSCKRVGCVAHKPER